MTEFIRVATASRVFSLAAIVGITIALDNRTALQAAFVVSVIAALAIYLSTTAAIPSDAILAGEAGLASLVVLLALPESILLLPYLVVLPLLAGLGRGLVGAAVTTAMQLVAILSLALTSEGLTGITEQSQVLAPWSLTIAGAGLLGAWVRTAGKAPSGSPDQKYEAARRLLGQLRHLARRLPSGLDPISIASLILQAVNDRMGQEQSAVLARTDGGLLTPLVYRGANARESLDLEDSLITDCFAAASVRIRIGSDSGSGEGTVAALPLKLGSEVVGVVYARGPAKVSPEILDPLQADLDDLSLRLATAIAFDEVRSLLTSDERQRLAREIHDGVAQEVASLGYALDELAAVSADPSLSSGLTELRSDISRIVSELRLSIFDLRTEVGDGPGLGTALSDYVRKVGSRSSMTVHLTLDESPTRLSPGVETELFRIAQEAITNARKHSQAQNLWVDCWVRPPSAFIRIRDDGRGLGVGRADSYGLRIMRERAERIDGSISVATARMTREQPGTCVTISVGSGVPQAGSGIGAA